MIASILNKIAFAAAKAGVAESAEYFLSLRAEMEKMLTQQTDLGLLGEIYAEERFNTQWASTAASGYMDRYRPIYPLQQRIFNDLKEWERGVVAPSRIPFLIIEYGYSQFFINACQQIKRGEEIGGDHLHALLEIVYKKFRLAGCEDLLLPIHEVKKVWPDLKTMNSFL